MVTELTLDFTKMHPEIPPLDEYQEEVIKAIKRGERNICVVGVPAAGKSRLEPAAVYTWLDMGISPLGILPVTWTLTARDNLQDRLGEVPVKAMTIYGHGMKHSLRGRELFLKDQAFEHLLLEREKGDTPFDWSFYDEGQDLTPKQYTSFISWAPNRILVGDPYQSVFGWAGGSPEGLNDFAKTHCDKKEPYHLSINHRSKKAIVDIAECFYPRGMKPSEENNSGGKVNIGDGYPSFIDNCTILTRWKRSFAKYQRFLLKEGIPHTVVESKDGGRLATNYDRDKMYSVTKEVEYFATVLMTIHCAKGDQWGNVLLESWTPYLNSNLREEENCFYVGLTRPEDQLYVKTRKGNYFNRRILND